MIAAAARLDGVTLEGAQTGSGLAGVGDPRLGAVDGRHVGGGERGDAAHPLREVQGDALRGQYAARRTGYRGEDVSCNELVTVADVQIHLDGRIGETEGGGEDLASAEDPGFSCDEIGRGRGLGGQQRGAREVAPRSVFLQCGADDAVQSGGGQHQTVSRIDEGVGDEEGAPVASVSTR